MDFKSSGVDFDDDDDAGFRESGKSSTKVGNSSTHSKTLLMNNTRGKMNIFSSLWLKNARMECLVQLQKLLSFYLFLR